MWAAGQSRLRPSARIICFLIKHSIATDCRPQCPHELTQGKQMMAMIGQSDLDHWDCPLNVLESDAIDSRASRYVP
jgi:hypothetical protein